MPSAAPLPQPGCRDTAAAAGRSDSPFEMHRSDSDASPSRDAAQSNPAPSLGDADGADFGPGPVQQAAKLLGHRLKVEVKDGRVLEGDFYCLDKQGNIVINNTQQLSGSDGASDKQQHMGLVLIPQHQQAACQLLVMPHEKKQMEALVAEAAA